MAGEPARLGGRRWLTGQPEDYRDPAGAILWQIGVLLREYEQQDGDLMNARILLGGERVGTRLGRPRAFVRLDGFRTSP